MKQVTIILFLLINLSFNNLRATDIPKLNLEIGKTYKISTTSFSDSSSNYRIVSYSKCVYDLTPLSFDKRKQVYRMQVVLDYYKYAFQRFNQDMGWVEESAYETGFPCMYTSPITNLNRNRVKLYIEVNTSGQLLNTDFSNYEKCKTREGLSLQLYRMDRNSLKEQLKNLFFQLPEKVDDIQWKKDNITYTLLQENAYWIALNAKYLSHNEDRQDYNNLYWIDKKTGLIREKKYSYLFTVHPPKYPSSGHLVSKYQRYIPIISNHYNLDSKCLFVGDSTIIKNTNTIICGHIAHIPKGTSNILVNVLNKSYRLKAVNDFRIELHLDERQGPVRVMVMAENEEVKLFDRHLSFYAMPGDSLYFNISLFKARAQHKVTGIGAFEVDFENKTLCNRPVYPGHKSKLELDYAKLEYLKNRSLLSPDYLLFGLNLFKYVPLLNLNAQNDTLAQVQKYLFNNSLAVNNPIYMTFVEQFMKKIILKDITKRTNTKNNKDNSLIGQYELAKLSYNEPVCGYLRYRMLLGILYHDWDIGDELSKRFYKEYKGSLLAGNLAEKHQLLSQTATGSKASRLILPDRNGKMFNLLESRGKLVSLRFWNLKNDWDRRRFPKRDTLFLLNKEEAYNIHVMMANQKEFNEAIKSAKIENDELILWANTEESNSDMSIWYSSHNKIFVLDRDGIIQWSKSSMPGIAFWDELLTKPYHPLKDHLIDVRLLLIISGSIIVLLLIVLLIYRILSQRRLRHLNTHKRVMELENKAIRSQMNPHFVFNALNSIQALINHHRIAKANLYLSKFALLLRRILKNSQHFQLSLNDELELIGNYCEIEQLRTSFHWEIKIDKEVEPEMIKIPGMLIQPLVENAIVHGLIPKKEDKNLIIYLHLIEGRLVIRVVDNGIGIQNGEQVRTSGNDLGIKLIKEKLAMLTNQGQYTNLEMVSVNKGTEVRITIGFD